MQKLVRLLVFSFFLSPPAGHANPLEEFINEAGIAPLRSRAMFDVQMATIRELFDSQKVLVLSGHGCAPSRGRYLVVTPSDGADSMVGILAEEFFEMLSAELTWSKYEAVLLLTCYSNAPGDEDSIAQRMARLSGLPVISPTGAVGHSLSFSGMSEELKFEILELVRPAFERVAGRLPEKFAGGFLSFAQMNIYVLDPPPDGDSWKIAWPVEKIKNPLLLDEILEILNQANEDRELFIRRWLAGAKGLLSLAMIISIYENGCDGLNFIAGGACFNYFQACQKSFHGLVGTFSTLVIFPIQNLCAIYRFKYFAPDAVI